MQCTATSSTAPHKGPRCHRHLASNQRCWEQMPKHRFGHSLQTTAAEDACHRVSHALDDDLRVKSHPQNKKHIAFVQYLVVVLFLSFLVFVHLVSLTVSCVLCDLANATVDTFQIEFLSKSQIENSRQHACSCNLRSHGRARFQRHCNFVDCDPIVTVNCFDHNATPTLAIFFSLPHQ